MACPTTAAADPKPPPETPAEMELEGEPLKLLAIDFDAVPPPIDMAQGRVLLYPETWHSVQQVLEHYKRLPGTCAAKQRAAAWKARKRNYHEWETCKARLDKARAEERVEVREGVPPWLVGVIAGGAAIVGAIIAGVTVHVTQK